MKMQQEEDSHQHTTDSNQNNVRHLGILAPELEELYISVA